MKTKDTKSFKTPVILFLVFFVFIMLLFLQYCYLAIFPNVYGINMKEFASKRNTYSQTLYAKRGTIYDSDGNTLAIDVSSYTVVAYLDASRTGEATSIYHVADKEATAKSLAPILNMTKEDLLQYLNQDLYQTYLGSHGKNITEITKQKIEELNLPGIEFEETYKRYYPNGNFASYLLGYAKNKNTITVQAGKTYDLKSILKNLLGEYTNITYKLYNNELADLTNDGILSAKQEGTTTIEILSNGKRLDDCVINVKNEEVKTKLENKIIGELGIEIKYEETLKGVNGFLEYQADRYGYKIPDTKENSQEAVDGSNVTLTIDSNIQRILENAVSTTNEKYSPEWITISVMDAKTGDILGSAATPSYNPNDLSTITNYENPLTSFVYEPGSVMKIFTYMCALEKGTYKGDETFLSGSIKVEDKTIYDWNRVGWGTINYDFGFQMSSNVGVSYIVQNFINKDDLKSCFMKYGFGSTTNIELPRELSGNVVFNYPVEVAAAAYGQGISTTPVQYLQALSILANNGKMVKPHIVKKITNGDKTIYERQVETVDNIVSDNTATYVKKLMYNTVNDTVNGATGTGYRVNGLTVIGKTGTAEIFNNETGSYANGNIYSFAGMFPYENPEIVIFVSVKRPNSYSSNAITSMTQPVMESIAKYKGLIKGTSANNDGLDKVVISNYSNQKVSDIKGQLEASHLNVIVLGDGEKIIDQYPKKDTTVLMGDKVYLLTNGTTIKMPSFKNYTRIEAISLLNLLGIPYEIEGYGIVTDQSIKEGEMVSDTTIKLTLKRKNDILNNS